MTRFSIYAPWLRFIDTRVIIYARHLAFITPLVGEFLTPQDLHVQILELDRDKHHVNQSGAAEA